MSYTHPNTQRRNHSDLDARGSHPQALNEILMPSKTVWTQICRHIYRNKRSVSPGHLSLTHPNPLALVYEGCIISQLYGFLIRVYPPFPWGSSPAHDNFIVKMHLKMCIQVTNPSVPTGQECPSPCLAICSPRL